MTTIAYYKGCLIADRLHNSADIPWIPVRTKSPKILISKCKRAAIAITGPAFGKRYRQDIVDAMAIGMAKHGGVIENYVHWLYDEKTMVDRKDVFADFGNFSLLMVTRNGAWSASRHSDDPEEDVMPRSYKPNQYCGFGTGGAAFQMLAHLNTPVEQIMPIISINDGLVSAEYDIVRPLDLQPFKPVIKA